MATLAKLRANHPLRPANWRWERANALFTNNLRTKRSQDDHYVARTLDYLRDRLDAGTDIEKREILSDRWGAFHVAYEIYTDDDKRARHMLEAWLLAHIPIQHVAIRSSLSLDVVRHYEAVFFNVLDRMDRGDWIMSQVLPQAVYEGVQQRDMNAMWKLVAYAGGEFVLEAFLRLVTNPNRPSSLDGVNTFCRTQGDNTQYRGRLANTWGMRTPDAHARLQLEEICLRMDEVRANTGAAGGAEPDFVAHVEAMMRSLPFGVGLAGLAGDGVPALGPAGPEERGGRELRVHEQMLMRLGLPVPSLEGMPPPMFPDKTDVSNQAAGVGE